MARKKYISNINDSIVKKADWNSDYILIWFFIEVITDSGMGTPLI